MKAEGPRGTVQGLCGGWAGAALLPAEKGLESAPGGVSRLPMGTDRQPLCFKLLSLKHSFWGFLESGWGQGSPGKWKDGEGRDLGEPEAQAVGSARGQPWGSGLSVALAPAAEDPGGVLLGGQQRAGGAPERPPWRSTLI